MKPILCNCGGPPIIEHKLFPVIEESFRVRCGICDRETYRYISEEKAIKEWNKMIEGERYV